MALYADLGGMWLTVVEVRVAFSSLIIFATDILNEPINNRPDAAPGDSGVDETSPELVESFALLVGCVGVNTS